MIRAAHVLLFAAATVAAITASADASACGGCLGPPAEGTQVTGHRMILSLAKDRTTLWDQITYSGEPSSFAWVLPIHGKVDVGLSSDGLFAELERDTLVTVAPPPLHCPPSPCPSTRANVGLASGGEDKSSSDPPPVAVLAQEVVGPYETVQLAATDPGALENWLSNHGYSIPADVQPVVDAYVKEGFDFLALKLVPGNGVQTMRPVRVTFPGASPVLPLRMVAAGTGAITPITLWVLAEARYVPANAPSFLFDPTGLVWRWDTSSSNYSELKKQQFAKTGNAGWLLEAGQSIYGQGLATVLTDRVKTDPAGSGYAGVPGIDANTLVAADLDALLTGISPTSLTLTRLHAELARSSLTADLQLEASPLDDFVPRMFQARIGIGIEPPCPVPACVKDSAAASHCAASPVEPASPGTPFFLLPLAALGLARRKRR